MKRIVLGLVMVLVAGVCVFAQSVPAVVVSTFTTRGADLTPDVGETITEYFIAELASKSGIRVIDRTTLDRVMSEMNFQISDWSNSNKTAQLGAALNADYFVSGNLNQLGRDIRLALKAQDVKTLEVVASSTDRVPHRGYQNGWSFREDDSLDWAWQTFTTDVLPKMATTLASTLQTRIAEKRAKDDEVNYARYIVGTWQTKDGKNTFYFYNDGTFRANYTVYDQQTVSNPSAANWLYQNYIISRDYVYSATGSYSLTNTNMNINFTFVCNIHIKTPFETKNETRNGRINFDTNIKVSNNGRTLMLVTPKWQNQGYFGDEETYFTTLSKVGN